MEGRLLTDMLGYYHNKLTNWCTHSMFSERRGKERVCVPSCYENSDTHEWFMCLHSSSLCT